jgi:hypothetical protein
MFDPPWTETFNAMEQAEGSSLNKVMKGTTPCTWVLRADPRGYSGGLSAFGE